MLTTCKCHLWQQTVDLGADHSAFTHKFVGCLYRDKSKTYHWGWPAAILNHSITGCTPFRLSWHYYTQHCSGVKGRYCNRPPRRLPMVLALTGWHIKCITALWMSSRGCCVTHTCRPVHWFSHSMVYVVTGVSSYIHLLCLQQPPNPSLTVWPLSNSSNCSDRFQTILWGFIPCL